MPNKFLLIGPYPYSHRPEAVGGASILFKEMIDFFKTKKIDCQIIPSNKYNSKIKSLRFILINIIRRLNYNIAILNLSQKGILYLFPVLFVLLKMFNFKIHLRFFGAHGYDMITNAKHKRLLIFFLKKSKNVFVETKSLVAAFQELGVQAKWFPNVRKMNTNLKTAKSFKKRFLFLGHIKRSKGILELIDVFEGLGSDYSLEIYGHIQEMELSFLKEHRFYKGFVNQDEINKIFQNNDVLVLPTYYEGEGYPGVIIEAFMNSLPVISTKWRYIPEIIDNKVNGILIRPMSKKKLKDAVLFFNKDNYKKFAKSSLIKSSEFESHKVHSRIMSEII
jgi:glycosyltransferase involved in cell wall biosynthesis